MALNIEYRVWCLFLFGFLHCPCAAVHRHCAGTDGCFCCQPLLPSLRHCPKGSHTVSLAKLLCPLSLPPPPPPPPALYLLRVTSAVRGMYYSVTCCGPQMWERGGCCFSEANFNLTGILLSSAAVLLLHLVQTGTGVLVYLVRVSASQICYVQWHGRPCRRPCCGHEASHARSDHYPDPFDWSQSAHEG